jgi:hypothetical protein
VFVFFLFACLFGRGVGYIFGVVVVAFVSSYFLFVLDIKDEMSKIQFETTKQSI